MYNNVNDIKESTIEQFRLAIAERLGKRYYFDEAPDNAAYPYRVGSLSNSYDDETAEIYTFYLDYWDSGKTTRRIRNMIAADSGNGDRFNATGLNGLKIHLPTGAAALYKNGENAVTDPDKGLRCIRVGYAMRLYDAIRGGMSNAESDTDTD
ncbi:hypothetical protein FACS18948_5230 [Clostridia bacterium]|nr:hypothetical protein FACS18948_5230 [Clostridia bacterium]